MPRAGGAASLEADANGEYVRSLSSTGYPCSYSSRASSDEEFTVTNDRDHGGEDHGGLDVGPDRFRRAFTIHYDPDTPPEPRG